MNPNELIQRYLHGEATDADVAELERLLASDPALRRKLIVETGIDSGLCEIARERASQPSVVTPRRSVWLSWRPLTAAAAGLVIGLFSASVVWGYVVPRITQASSIWLPVMKGSFEKPMEPLKGGASPSLATWSGDKCAVVSAENGIEPLHQMHMLRVIGSAGKNANGRATLSGEFIQLVDMRPFKEQFADGCADLKCSAWFNAVADTAGQDYTATFELYALCGDPSAVPADETRSWLARENIVRTMKRIVFDDDPAKWQASGVRVELPPETDFVAVTFRLAPAPPLLKTVPAAFPGHYVDFVRLALVSSARETSNDPMPTDSD